MNLKFTIKMWTTAILSVFISMSLLFLYCAKNSEYRLLPLKDLQDKTQIYTRQQIGLAQINGKIIDYLQHHNEKAFEDIIFNSRSLHEEWQLVVLSHPAEQQKFALMEDMLENIVTSSEALRDENNLNVKNEEFLKILPKIYNAETYVRELKRAYLEHEIQSVKNDIQTFIHSCIILLTVCCSIGILLIIWLNFQLSSKISNNIRLITQAITRSLSGEKGLEIRSSLPEFHGLVNTCNLLIQTLHAHSDLCKNEVTRESQIRKGLIETLKEPTIVVTNSGEILATNTAFRLLIDSNNGNLFLAELQQAITEEYASNFFTVEGVDYQLIPQITPKSCPFSGKIFQLKKK